MSKFVAKSLMLIYGEHIGISVKVKLTLEQATKAQRDSICIALLFP